MLPLIPIVLSLAPQVAKWIFGDKGADVTRDVAVAIQSVTGHDATTAEGVVAAQAALAGKPELAIQLQQRLAEIGAQREAEANREADARRQAELDELKQRIADVAGARAQTTTLAAARNPLAYGSAVLSAIILISFATMLYFTLTRTNDLKSPELVNVLFGTLAAMATQVANYWLGSSSGSAAKNEILREQSNQLAASTPGPAVQIASVTETPGAPGQPATTTATATTQPLQSQAMPIQPSQPQTVRVQSTAPQEAQPLTTDELNDRSLAAAKEER